MHLLITHQSISWLHFELEIHRYSVYINLCHKWDKWVDGRRYPRDNDFHVNNTLYAANQEVPEQLCAHADTK